MEEYTVAIICTSTNTTVLHYTNVWTYSKVDACKKVEGRLDFQEDFGGDSTFATIAYEEGDE